MDISTLKLFIAVMRERSFTDVANAYRLAPSSVSRTIAALEKELGIRLFQRSTRKLEPTEAGMIYFTRILPFIDELEAAQQFAADVSKEPRGTLRVTTATSYGQVAIVPLLPKFAKRYPLVSIELVLTDNYLDLIEDRIDVAIRLGKLENSSHIAKRLAKIDFYICASPEYLDEYGKPERPEQIKDHKCLLFPRAGHSLNWLLKDRQQNITEIAIGGKCLITNALAIKQCLLNGMGLSLLPDWLVGQDINEGRLIHLFTDYVATATDFESSVWLLYPSKDYLPLKTRVFIDFLQTEMGL
ncbi:MAG: LysR family transcriptional regulator [Methylobacter sp.]|nr:MAG: LysR family transcriptional regulator [Methylobacter sp.]